MTRPKTSDVVEAESKLPRQYMAVSGCAFKLNTSRMMRIYGSLHKYYPLVYNLIIKKGHL